DGSTCRQGSACRIVGNSNCIGEALSDGDFALMQSNACEGNTSYQEGIGVAVDRLSLNGEAYAAECIRGANVLSCLVSNIANIHVCASQSQFPIAGNAIGNIELI